MSFFFFTLLYFCFIEVKTKHITQHKQEAERKYNEMIG